MKQYLLPMFFTGWGPVQAAIEPLMDGSVQA